MKAIRELSAKNNLRFAPRKNIERTRIAGSSFSQNFID